MDARSRCYSRPVAKKQAATPSYVKLWPVIETLPLTSSKRYVTLCRHQVLLPIIVGIRGRLNSGALHLPNNSNKRNYSKDDIYHDLNFIKVLGSSRSGCRPNWSVGCWRTRLGGQRTRKPCDRRLHTCYHNRFHHGSQNFTARRLQSVCCLDRSFHWVLWDLLAALMLTDSLESLLRKQLLRAFDYCNRDGTLPSEVNK